MLFVIDLRVHAVMHAKQSMSVMQGTFKEHAEIAREVATGAPYKEWVNSNHRLEEMVTTNQYLQETQMDSSQVLRLQAANGTFSLHTHVANIKSAFYFVI